VVVTEIMNHRVVDDMCSDKAVAWGNWNTPMRSFF